MGINRKPIVKRARETFRFQFDEPFRDYFSRVEDIKNQVRSVGHFLVSIEQVDFNDFHSNRHAYRAIAERLHQG
jgi:hypothetical protein